MRPLTGISIMLSAIVLVMVSAVLTKPVSSGSFPGTNGKIVFTSSRDGNKEIYVMDADGSNQTRLTNDSAVDENPSWSADGNKIVFQSNRTGSPQIFIMDKEKIS